MRKERVLALATIVITAASYLSLTSPAHASSGTVTFTDSDSGSQFFFVPYDVSTIAVIAYGGQGGAGGLSNTSGGRGARVHTTSLAVNPGELLSIDVGGAGEDGGDFGQFGGGGANNGGLGGSGSGFGTGGGGGGGGSSAVLRSPYSLADRLVVAAGGGGGGGFGASGGAGGLLGTNGGSTAAGGGQSGGNGGAGGAGAGGGTAGSSGSAGTGGNGGSSFDGGGGGGGGAVGGGGGGGNGLGDGAAGGGGGSSLGPANATFQTGVRSGAGEVTIIFGDDDAPIVTLEEPANGSSTNDPTPTMAGRAGTGVGDPDVTVSIWPGPTPGNGPLQTLQAPVAPDGSYSVDAAALADGVYTARAHQTDASGNFGGSSFNTFTIDTVAPDTQIDSKPRARTTKRSATFTFSEVIDEDGTTFLCKLDLGIQASCESPKIYTQLSRTTHTFSVWAVDEAGNVDPTPATFTWRIRRP